MGIAVRYPWEFKHKFLEFLTQLYQRLRDPQSPHHAGFFYAPTGPASNASTGANLSSAIASSTVPASHWS